MKQMDILWKNKTEITQQVVKHSKVALCLKI
jgi:hypothetical protein